MYVLQLCADRVVRDAELGEDLSGNIVVIAKEREEEVLGPDDIILVEFCFEVGDLQNLFCLLGQGDVADRQRSAGGPDGILDRLLDLEKISPKVAKDLHCDPLTLTDNPKEQMLCADIIVTKSKRLLAT